MHPLDQFEAEWGRGNVPEIVDYLQRLSSLGDEEQFTELCQIDLERRWRSVDPNIHRRFVRDYFIPGVNFSSRDLIELIRWEFYVRNRWGDFPHFQSILRQWPEHQHELASVLHEASREISRPIVTLQGMDHQVVPFLLEGTLEVGRQRTGEPAPFTLLPTDYGCRLIAARVDEPEISRQQLRIRQYSENSIEVVNTSRNRAMATIGKGAIGSGEQAVFELPVQVHLYGPRILHFDKKARGAI